MSRVSQEELYNDKDVVTQILKLKDTVNDYAGGIIENIDVSGNDLVIDWADGTSISLPLPNPTGISSVAGAVSGGNLTITFYMTDGSSHAFTCPLTGMATEAYVDGLDAQNVKLTGAQTVGGVKTFSDSPIVPNVPAMGGAINDIYANDATAGVNNIVHKTGNEDISGVKTVTGSFKFTQAQWTTPIEIKNTSHSRTDGVQSGSPQIRWTDKDGNTLGLLRVVIESNSTTKLQAIVINSNGSEKALTIVAGDVI